ncbi:uncharacterized protein [Panulirus ornatus]
MLTYEDFLRPTALMVLHHSAVIAHTTSDKDQEEEDPLYRSLNPSVLLGAGKKSDTVEDIEGSKVEKNTEVKGSKKIEVEKVGKWEKSNEISRDNVSTKQIDCCAVDVRFKTTEKSQTDETLIKQNSVDDVCPDTETYRVLRTHVHTLDDRNQHIPVCQEKLVRSQSEIQVSASVDTLSQESIIKPPHIKKHESLLENTIEKICQATRDEVNLLEVGSKEHEDLNFAKHECVCGGFSKAWRERLVALREAETAVREREIAVKEREREVSHREHRVAAMEREARQHLVRAQIYLRQSRPRQNAATSPHRPPSDLDTTVSADPGDEDVATTVKLDPQQIDNPFLKMRGIQPPPEKRVSFKEKPTRFKSNTLDNPKSRRKRGNIFSLVERATETSKEVKEKVLEEIHCRVPFKAVSGNAMTSQQQGQKPNFLPDKKSQESSLPPAFLPNLQKPAQDSISNPDLNITHVLRERPRSTENLSKKSLDTWSDKENVVLAVKQKKMPEFKSGLWSRSGNKGAERPGRREHPTFKSQKHVLHFYNVV